MVKWSKVEAEIAKCDIVCVNCHRLRTYKGQNSYKTRSFNHHRSVLDELKRSTPCLDCGCGFEPCQVDFDHQPDTDKVMNVARMVERSTDALLAELTKCHLVCANCHRIRTHTGERKNAPGHGAMLVARFEEIRSRTQFPEDKRHGEFPFPELLGTMSDEKLAAKIGEDFSSRRTLKSAHFNGKGISKEMVAYYRRKEGIPPFKPKSKTAPKSWHKLLGTMPDVKVAEVANRSPATIHYHRNRLGIPPYEAQV